MTRYLFLIILILISVIVIISLNGISHDAMLILASITIGVIAGIPTALIVAYRSNQTFEVHDYRALTGGENPGIADENQKLLPFSGNEKGSKK